MTYRNLHCERFGYILFEGMFLVEPETVKTETSDTQQCKNKIYASLIMKRILSLTPLQIVCRGSANEVNESRSSTYARSSMHAVSSQSRMQIII